jgi:hypothetical protein
MAQAAKDPRSIRKQAKRSMMWTAVQAGVSEPLVRLYEANRAAVGEERRLALDAVYAAMMKAPAKGTIGS